jgi:hypothetical protein
MNSVADLDPRRDMGLIRERIENALSSGKTVTDILQDLATRNPIALADLVVGPKAPTHPAWVRAAIDVIDVLEGSLAPNGLYRRLVSLSPETNIEVLSVAARRHPSASWLIELSRHVEGQQAGLTHLLASVGHPAFAQNCWEHAAAGHLPGLIAVAEETGCPEPAAALAAQGHIDAAALALVCALRRSHESPVVAMTAAAWGPDLEVVLLKTLPHLRSRAVAETLREHTRGYPGFFSLLETVIRAMVQT